MRKVIFIGGTSYSGSTLTDLILSHDPRGFSCGELSAYVHPFREKHLHADCGCGDENCGIWRQVDTSRRKHIHQQLFELFPDVEFLVDSSKSPIWIQEQNRALRAQGVDVHNVLVWKTPAEFHRSREKRGTEQGWAEDWITYHRRFFSLGIKWVSVPYRSLLDDPSVLERLCDSAGICNFSHKADYWKQQHHTLFGNASAKIHLHDIHSDAYQDFHTEISKTVNESPHTRWNGNVHRQLVKECVDDDNLAIDEDSERLFADIQRVLTVTGVHHDAVDWTKADKLIDPLRVNRGLFPAQRWLRAARRLRTQGKSRSSSVTQGSQLKLDAGRG